MKIEYLHKFSTEEYIISQYNDDYKQKGYWYFNFDEDNLYYNWRDPSEKKRNGPYKVRIGDQRDFDDRSIKLYQQFKNDWIKKNAHKPSL